MTVAGSLLVPGTTISAVTLTAPVTTEQVLVQNKPPKINQVRCACYPESATVSLRLHNPNRVELSYEVRLFGGDAQEAQAVHLPAKTAERVAFHGIPNGKFSIQVLDDLGATVASADVVVECPTVVRQAAGS
ncbi:hypothetical protein [Actinophytocola xanthii]|nr:hypothetical protein [Actinophytocola xanthii]